MANRQAMVDAVRSFARQHYNAAGWDVVVECYDDADIERIIVDANATTIDAAIRAVHRIVSTVSDMREDAILAGGEPSTRDQEAEEKHAAALTALDETTNKETE